jgi:hypothetical protein
MSLQRVQFPVLVVLGWFGQHVSGKARGLKACHEDNAFISFWFIDLIELIQPETRNRPVIDVYH